MLPEFEYIETPRLLLRKITPDVYAPVLDALNDEQLKEFTGFTDDASIAKERKRHAGGLSSHALTFLYFHILDKATGKPIGSAGFYRHYREHDRGELGYALYNEADRRKGYTKEGLKAIIAYGFNQMNLHRIEVLISPGNDASLRVAELFGFKFEGHLKEHYLDDEGYSDSLIFGLLKKDYLSEQD